MLEDPKEPRSGPLERPPRSDAELQARVAASKQRIGDVIDERYQLLRPLSAGGAGVVWVAQDSESGVQVALKILDSHDPDSVRRMGLEAQAAARLDHPGVVQVHRLGTTRRGRPYLAMELLRGESFATILARERRIPPAAAVRLLLPVADTLHAAHLAGIVHRDLKPDNVFIARGATGRLQPKVLDFGSARLIRSGPPLTAEGFAVGTPPYMSPEQITGRRAIDHRSDIWSLCVLLYRAMAGRRPFAGTDHVALFVAIAHEEPAPLTQFGVGDGALWTVIHAGLGKTPDERYPTMFALGQALAGWLVTQGYDEDTTGAPLRATWLEPEGKRRELSTARPSISPKIRDDEFEAPFRLRYEQIAGRQASSPEAERSEPSKPGRRSVAWAMVGLALLALGAGVYVFLRLPPSDGAESPPSAESSQALPPPVSSARAAPPSATPSSASPSSAPSAEGANDAGATKKPSTATSRRRRLRGTFGL
jgi:serine/threonine-protein kinase